MARRDVVTSGGTSFRSSNCRRQAPARLSVTPPTSRPPPRWGGGESLGAKERFFFRASGAPFPWQGKGGWGVWGYPRLERGRFLRFLSLATQRRWGAGGATKHRCHQDGLSQTLIPAQLPSPCSMGILPMGPHGRPRPCHDCQPPTSALRAAPGRGRPGHAASAYSGGEEESLEYPPPPALLPDGEEERALAGRSVLSLRKHP